MDITRKPLLVCSDVTVIDHLGKETRMVANKAIITRFQDSEEKVLRSWDTKSFHNKIGFPPVYSFPLS